MEPLGKGVVVLPYLSCSEGCPVVPHPICGVAGISPGTCVEGWVINRDIYSFLYGPGDPLRLPIHYVKTLQS